MEANEILRDEQLDQVAGSTYLESADDAKRFKDLGVNFIGSKEVSRAWKHIKAQFGK
ncbi:MAG: hypothetical protein IJR52_00440 [Selenomonadaceae bacterium]|nr:hypothetical protein [Selenomonadaceae bacterium]